ncbi:MAG: signal peptidase I, partial [Planctomycetota bacterium]
MASKAEDNKTIRKDRVVEIANTFEWLITAFVLAFIFRAFIMEAFRIPTGSMASTLMGAHFRLRCPQCGYKYEYGFKPGYYGLPEDSIPRGPVKPIPSRCPSCGYFHLTGGNMPIANGDRILVLKCVYQFLPPKRWDVVVFKNPLEPQISYIKRLVGLPGETVEIINGDIYINGQIARKPRKVQDELWMPVFDNDYQPARPRQGSFNGHFWQQPLTNSPGSNWQTKKDRPTMFFLERAVDEINSLVYDTSLGNDFRVTYAYNDIRGFSRMSICSDLKVRFYATSEKQGVIGISLSKYETTYNAFVDPAGQMIIQAVKAGETVELKRKQIVFPPAGKVYLVQLENVDHQLIFQIGSEKMYYDMGRSSSDAGPRQSELEPRVKIFGSGVMTLSHVAIFRDIHYTSREYINGPKFGNAVDGNPLTLQP